jgi:sulfite reductase beta subunit-like hemoprotein
MSAAVDAKAKVKLPKVVENEIALFRENIALLKAGKMEMDDFRRFRLNNGIYGIRGHADKQMVRVKVSFGKLTPEQLEGLADITEQYAPMKLGHWTTRQNLQIHLIPLEVIPDVMRRIAEIGLTTREACGNTVRTVTACPYSGVHPQQAFDVTPYAEAAFNYFLRNPLNANLPRKFKIAFESCPVDHSVTPIHDLGAVAEIKDGKRGFRLYVGGGLGATPHVAVRLEDWTPAELLLPTAEAIIRLFDRYGERKDKMHARLKFVVKKWGAEEFCRRVIEERKIVLATRSGAVDWTYPVVEETAPVAPSDIPKVSPAEGFDRWKATNVSKQIQPGYSFASVVFPLGDTTAAQMRALAGIARRFCGGRMRTTIEQNIVLRWVKDEHLPALHAELAKAGLATAGANRFSDVTRCPGADTCQIAVTKSRELAIAVGKVFSNGLAPDADMENVHVKISGCTNSCGQHHIGTLGFYGTYRKVGERQVPHYQLLIGGSTVEGEAKFGVPVTAVPARRVPDAIKAIVAAFKKEKQSGESFDAWLNRAGRAKVKEIVLPFTELPPYEQEPSLYYDWGDTSDFKAEIGAGECAA